jgi:hypothetical protein
MMERVEMTMENVEHSMARFGSDSSSVETMLWTVEAIRHNTTILGK